MEDERGRRRDEMRKTGKEMTKTDTVDVQPRSLEDPNKREEVCVCVCVLVVQPGVIWLRCRRQKG